MKPAFLLLTLAVLCLGAGRVNAQQFLKSRSSEPLRDWTFHKGDIYGADSGNTDAAGTWENVTVPHTWNAKDILTEGVDYRQGSGWYRTHFSVAQDAAHSRWFVRFEGASSVAEVYCNGEYLGRHEGGYSAFIFEVTACLRPGENVLAVKVNNESNRDVAPSAPALYPIFGGIYRPVTLFSTPDTCISPLDCASPGVYIRPGKISENTADLSVDVLVDHKSIPRPQSCSGELRAPDGSPGLLGSYYASGDFTGDTIREQVDADIDFDYKKGAPEGLPDDFFSVVWTGEFVPESSGTYRFFLNSDDGSRLSIDGKTVVENWGNHSADEAASGDIKLKKDEAVAVRLEYFEAGGNASIRLSRALISTPAAPGRLAVKAEILERDGSSVATASKDAATPDDGSETCTLPLQVSKPRLWNGVRDPYLYTLRVTLSDPAAGTTDVVEQPLGLRNFHVDVKEGLILNGDYYDLHGVSRHQEWEGSGPALSGGQNRRDFALMKELGCTGLRLAHYQQADIMYAMADRAGMVVWAEIPNTPIYREGNPKYLANCLSQLEELVKQNYNHPSIFFWGLYNEVTIPVEDLGQLNDLAHKLDPSRLTTCADLSEPEERDGITDLIGWNKYYGWYYGGFDDYAGWFEKYHSVFPDIPAGMSEYGAGGCITQHQVPPEEPDAWEGRFYPEEYQSLYHEQVWSRVKDRHDIWCKFVWNMFDFSWPEVHRGDRDSINHKGLVTHDRKTRKDAFYFYKANWSREPVLHICSSRFTERNSASVPVTVYSNMDAVELYVNGAFVSSKSVTSDIHKVEWPEVTLLPGKNRIDIVGHRDGKILTDSCVWTLLPEGQDK